MIDPFLLALIAGITIFLLSNGALLNALIAERRKLNQLWKEIEYAFMHRADLIPLLVETFQEYTKIEKKSFDVLLKTKHKAYLTHQPNSRIKEENKLDDYIDQIMSKAQKTKKLKKDIDFLELKSLFTKRRKEISKLINKYNKVAAQFDHHYHSIFSILVRPLMKWKGPAKLTEYH